MYIDVEWHKWPDEKPYAFPGKTPFYVTVQNPNGSVFSKIENWYHLESCFENQDIENIIAWAYIPHSNAYIPKEV